MEVKVAVSIRDEMGNVRERLLYIDNLRLMVIAFVVMHHLAVTVRKVVLWRRLVRLGEDIGAEGALGELLEGEPLQPCEVDFAVEAGSCLHERKGSEILLTARR